MDKVREDDLIIISADHGNDPTWHGTDHTRELVPLIIYSKALKGHGLLPVCDSFAWLGQTVADNFDVQATQYGRSLLPYIK